MYTADLIYVAASIDFVKLRACLHEYITLRILIRFRSISYVFP